MSVRHVARRVVVSIAATAAAGSFAALAFAVPAAVPAGASTACSSSGDQCLTAAQPQPGFHSGPFDSGQNINVVVPGNETFCATTSSGCTNTANNNNSAVNVLECSAPNGVLPSQPSACDGNTIQGNTILPNADGSFNYSGYTIYALPDVVTFGESSGGPVCGNTLATECVLYIGNNQGDFTKPHLWSQPFLVNTNGNDLGSNPGDGTPEVPMAIILPLAGMGVLGGTLLLRRHRAQRAA